MSELSSQTILCNKYKLLGSKLGEGGLGRVFLAQEMKTGETVAVKETIKEIKNVLIRQLSRNQISTMEMLQGSPHILAIKDYFEQKNRQYIVSQFCEGGTLSSLIKKKQLTPSTTKQFLQQILLGCIAMEKASIIHRDLKPLNILLKNGKVKIADFGFATTLSLLSMEKTMSLGSKNYMAPESICNHRYSSKSDVWSLGVIFYEMITGAVPWTGKSKKNLFQSILKNPVTEIYPKKAEGWIKKFLRRALEPVEYKRASFEELMSLVPEDPVKQMSNLEKAECQTLASSTNSYEELKIINKTKQIEIIEVQKVQNKLNSVKSEKLLTFVEKKQNQTKSIARQTPTIQKEELKKNNMDLLSPRGNLIRNKGSYQEIVKTLTSYIDFCRFQYQILKIFDHLKKKSMTLKTECLRNKVEFFLSNNILATFKKVEDFDFGHFQILKINEFQISSQFMKIISVVNEYKKSYGLKKYHEEVQTHCLDKFLDWMEENKKTFMSDLFFVLFDSLLNLQYLLCLSKANPSKFAEMNLPALVMKLRRERKKANESVEISGLVSLKQKMKKISLLEQTS